MKKIDRRSFIKGSLITTAGIGMSSTLASSAWGQVRGANEDVRMGIIGIRSKGAAHVNDFRKLEGVRVVALCDVDSDVLAREVRKFTDRNETVEAYTDVRKLLDNKDIDAVAIATPNHWHSLITIWACQAGKDVYVEKPVSHNIFEGRKCVEAARKYNRIVQTGTQKRSDPGITAALEYIQGGNLGNILYSYGLCYKRRKSIGKVAGPQPIPRSVDYNLWTGPAQLRPLRRKSLHYDWHWVWPTGNGDIGNQGVHEMDMAVWALGKTQLPSRVIGIGGRFGYDDDGTTPNTMLAILDYKPAPLFFEVRGLPENKQLSNTLPHYRGVRVGLIVQCENGYFSGGGGGGWVYDNQGKKIKQFTGDGGRYHQKNFIKAVRSRKRQDLTADIEKGHLSAALCHMANASYRVGQTTEPEKIREAIKDRKHAPGIWKRTQEHLFMNWVDLVKTPPTLGAWLDFDPQKERFVEDGEYSPARWANDLLTRNYRKPFVVPETV